MALISKIRNNSWILVVLVGLGLGGFIIMDMTSGQQSVLGSGNTTLGVVEGEKINIQEFQRVDQIKEQMFRTTDPYFRREFLWNYMVEKILLEKEAEALGLGVSRQELKDLQFGPNYSPIIMQYYGDPRTGQINQQQLTNIQQAIEGGQFTDPRDRSFWAQQEREVIKQRLQGQLEAMASQGVYSPSWMAELENKSQSQRMEFAYVAIPFDELDNSEVTVTDDDLENYLESNSFRFESKEETRTVSYATFPVAPTALDSAFWEAQIDTLLPGFRETDNDSLYVMSNFGRMDGIYQMKEAVPPSIADTVFSVPVGTVVGPYVEGRAYQAVKVVDRKVLPDSVRSRHIILQPQTQQEYFANVQTLDSLKTLLENGEASWDSLALAFSTDAGRTKGGDLGYYALDAPLAAPYKNLIFYTAEEGRLYVITTEFGVHLVEVTGKKFINNQEGVKLAFLDQSIIPRQGTIDSIFDIAYDFLNGKNSITELRDNLPQGILMENSQPLKENDFNVGNLGAGQTSRDIVKWAFENASAGDVAPEVFRFRDPVENYVDRFVVLGLENVQPAGLPSVASVQADIELQVINEKKAEAISGRIAGKTLEAVASDFGLSVDSIAGLTFNSTSIPEIGYEPKVIAAAYALNSGDVSQPVVGESGVFMIRMISKPEVGVQANIPQLRRTMTISPRQQARSQLLTGLRDKAAVKDNRSTFF